MKNLVDHINTNHHDEDCDDTCKTSKPKGSCCDCCGCVCPCSCESCDCC